LFDRGYEAIAAAVQSFYEAGFFSGVSKCFSQLAQCSVQTIVEIYKCVSWPE
jgi:hypothetical protein